MHIVSTGLTPIAALKSLWVRDMATKRLMGFALTDEVGDEACTLILKTMVDV